MHEIELDGTVVHFTSRTVPEKEIEETQSEGIYIKLMYLLILLIIYWLCLAVADESGLCEKYAADIDVLIGLHSIKPIEINVMFVCI